MLERFRKHIILNDNNQLETKDNELINRFDSASKINYTYSTPEGDVENVKDMLDIIADELWYVNPTATLQLKSADGTNVYTSTLTLETGSICGNVANDLLFRLSANKTVTDCEVYFHNLGSTVDYDPTAMPIERDYRTVPGYTLISSSTYFTGRVTDSKGTIATSTVNIYFYHPLFYFTHSNTESYVFTNYQIYDDFTKLIKNTATSPCTFTLSSFDNQYVYFAHPTWNNVSLQVYSNIAQSWVTIELADTLGSYDTISISSTGLDNNWTKTYYVYRTLNKMGAPDSTNNFRIVNNG